METFNETNSSVFTNANDPVILQINRYMLLVILIFGNIGSCLNLLVYRRAAYISSTCTIYLIAASINTIFLLDFALLTRLLEARFGIQTSAQSVIYCKIRTYIYYVMITFNIYCTVLASMDRYLSTIEMSTKLKFLQSRAFARHVTWILALLYFAVYGHILHYYGIDPIQHLCCACLQTAYATFFAWFFVVVYCLLPTILMSVFGILTVYNIHRLKRVLPNNRHMLHHRECHLIRIILFSILITLLFTLPFGLKQVYMAFVKSKETGYSTEEKFITELLRLPFYVNHAMAFYLNFLVSKGFRREFFKTIKH